METHNGIKGVTTDRQKVAIDGLIYLLMQATGHTGEGQKVLLHGRCWRVKKLDESGEEFDLYCVAEVNLVTGKGGCAIRNSEYGCIGMLKACEDYLHQFYTAPFRPEGWRTDIDSKADAEFWLRKLWAPQPATA